MNAFYRVIHFLVAWIVRVLYNVKCVGRENEPKSDKAYLICANHFSASDPAVVAASLRRVQPHFMAKKEVIRIPIIGWLLRGLGAFPIDRKGNDIGALKKTLKMLEKGKSVGIFPQGTRHKGEEPRDTKVKSGVGLILAHSGVDVLPVYVKTKDYRSKLFRRQTVIIGKPITAEEIGYVPHKTGEYERISRFVFDKICDLGAETLGTEAEAN